MKKNLLKEQYARLFKGRPMSNDAKLIKENVDFEQYIDVDKMQQINRYDDRDSQSMYEDQEEIIVPSGRTASIPITKFRVIPYLNTLKPPAFVETAPPI